MNDYSDYLDDAPSDVGVSTLARLGQQLVEAELAVLKAEYALKKAQDIRKDIEERQIPEAMSEAGIEELKLKGGTVIGLDEVLGVTVKKENKQRVLNWLEKEGHGGIIKRTLSVAFNKDQQVEADNLIKILVEEHGMPTKEEREYASQTLKKIVRERREAGKEVPDIIDVYSAQKAVIIKGKPKLHFDEE
jgi:hypothetical protein